MIFFCSKSLVLDILQPKKDIEVFFLINHLLYPNCCRENLKPLTSLTEAFSPDQFF